MAKILIIDDDQLTCEMIANVISDLAHEAEYTLTLKEGIARLYAGTFDIVFLDVNLPDGNGLEELPKIREAPASPDVIIITGQGDPDGAELAIKSGAWDYIEKPLSSKRVSLPLLRSLQYREEKSSQKAQKALKHAGIIGSSPQMKRCLDLVAQASYSDASVLIAGETGTGKELFARAIHENCSRRNNNFVIIDCATLPESLVESALFGHEKGAFTGADRSQEGLVKQADGGTLFLDEVGELPLSLQKAFLRVIQEHRFRPIGSHREIASDFKLITATHRNLDQMLKTGQFRQDLLFRIQSITIDLPPLRERPEDIKELVLYYMSKLCYRYGIGKKDFTPEFIDTLVAYNWPGNVRELVNALERSISAAGHVPTLFPMHLPPHIRVRLARSAVGAQTQSDTTSQQHGKISNPFPPLREFIDKTERQYLSDLMSHTGGNIKKICRISGLSRSRLYERLKKYNISRHI